MKGLALTQPSRMILDTGLRVVGPCRKVLSTFHPASKVHHPTVGTYERDRRVVVFSNSRWVDQRTSAVFRRGSSRDRVLLAL